MRITSLGLTQTTPTQTPRTILYRHPQINDLQFTFTKNKTEKDIAENFQSWLKKTTGDGMLSRLLNDIKLLINEEVFYQFMNPSRIFPIYDYTEEDQQKFLESKQAANRQASCRLDVSTQLPLILSNEWTKDFIKTSSPTFPQNLAAIEDYLNNTYRMALDILLDEKNKFEPWVSNLLGVKDLEHELKQNNANRHALLIQLTAALVMWLQVELNKFYGIENSIIDLKKSHDSKEIDKINYNYYTSIVVYCVVSDINNTVLSEFITHTLLVRKSKGIVKTVTTPTTALNLKESPPTSTPTSGKYNPSTVDVLNLDNFIQQFGNPRKIIIDQNCTSNSNTSLDSVACYVFSTEHLDSNKNQIALCRTAKDFSNNNSNITPPLTLATITPLETILTAISDSKITFQKIIVPISVTAEMHFRVLVIEPTQEKGKKTKVAFYDSRPFYILPIKQTAFAMMAYATSFISAAKPSTPSITESLEYIEKTCQTTFGDIDFQHQYTAQQLNDIDCGVYVTHYSLNAATQIPLQIDVAQSRQHDAERLNKIFDTEGNSNTAAIKQAEKIYVRKNTSASHDLKSAVISVSVPASNTNNTSTLLSPEAIKATSVSAQKQNNHSTITLAAATSLITIDTALPKTTTHAEERHDSSASTGNTSSALASTSTPIKLSPTNQPPESNTPSPTTTITQETITTSIPAPTPTANSLTTSSITKKQETNALKENIISLAQCWLWIKEGVRSVSSFIKRHPIYSAATLTFTMAAIFFTGGTILVVPAAFAILASIGAVAGVILGFLAPLFDKNINQKNHHSNSGFLGFLCILGAGAVCGLAFSASPIAMLIFGCIGLATGLMTIYAGIKTGMIRYLNYHKPSITLAVNSENIAHSSTSNQTMPTSYSSIFPTIGKSSTSIKPNINNPSSLPTASITLANNNTFLTKRLASEDATTSIVAPPAMPPKL